MLYKFKTSGTKAGLSNAACSQNEAIREQNGSDYSYVRSAVARQSRPAVVRSQ